MITGSSIMAARDCGTRSVFKLWGNYFVLISLAMMISACTSLVGKGDELFKAGNYHEAAGLYEQALSKDPNNVDAAIGLKRARTKIIDRDLIETRMLRLASNMQAAAEKLEQVLANQSEWNIVSQGAVAATQTQEVRFIKPWLLEEASRIAQSKYPDQLLWFADSFKNLIPATKSTSVIDDKLIANQSKGRNKCKSLATRVSGQRFFLHEFVRSYCSSWNEAVNLRTDANDRSRYSGLSIDQDLRFYAGRDSVLRDDINQHIDDLRERFRNDIWYAAAGQDTLTVDIGGEVNYKRTRHRERRQKNYVVTNSVSREDAEGKLVSSAREIKKIHQYYTWVYNESLRMQVQIRSKVVGIPVARSANLSRNNRTEEHAEDFSAAGLYPLAPEFLNIDALVDARFSDLIADYFSALNEAWRTQYCGSRLGDEGGENVLRCAAVDADNTEVSRWFEQEFGLSSAQMTKLYSI